MKLFVWDGPNTLPDYGSGIIFAHAETVDAARALVKQDHPCACEEMVSDWLCAYCDSVKPDPKVFEGPTSFAKWGGG